MEFCKIWVGSIDILQGGPGYCKHDYTFYTGLLSTLLISLKLLRLWLRDVGRGKQLFPKLLSRGIPPTSRGTLFLSGKSFSTTNPPPGSEPSVPEPTENGFSLSVLLFLEKPIF